MPRNPSTPATIVVIIVCLFIGIFFFGPFLWWPFAIHCKIASIKRHQDPEELRAWASHLIAVYSASNTVDVIPCRVTNKPPSGIPTSGRDPRVFIQRVPPDGPYHVVLLWGYGLENWGMDIGDTNYVSASDRGRTTEWKPGITFAH